MKIFVKAKPKAKKGKVEKINQNHFAVWVKEPPIKGMANIAIIKLLADYFSKAPSQVKIISGQTSRDKIIEIS